jgi:outer membrane protein OmpA-like peptidoglycan-associated protein
MMKRSMLLVAALAAGVTAGGCSATTSNQTKGAVIGATSGGAIGAMIGNATGSTGTGAVLGALVGGAGGAVIGHQMDQQAKEIQHSVPNANVARMGEGMDVTFASAVLFNDNSDVLTEQARTNLTSLAQSLQKYPNTNVMIVGHTDSTGSESHDLDLSRRRAAATANYLKSQGVAANRIRAVGRGATEPVAPNDNEADRQRNRRVEVAIYASESFKQQARNQ